MWIALLRHPTDGWLDYTLVADTHDTLCRRIKAHMTGDVWNRQT